MSQNSVGLPTHTPKKTFKKKGTRHLLHETSEMDPKKVLQHFLVLLSVAENVLRQVMVEVLPPVPPVPVMKHQKSLLLRRYQPMAKWSPLLKAGLKDGPERWGYFKYTSRWWFLPYFLFSPLFGEMIHFD